MPSTPASSAQAWTKYPLNSVESVAVSGPRGSLLYVTAAANPSATLSVFNRLTGRLIHRISVPGIPGTLRIGPGGFVWLAFGPSGTGTGTGLWLLGPDLTWHSSLNSSSVQALDLTDFLPIGRYEAVVTDGGRLEDARMSGPDGEGSMREVAALPVDHGFGGHVTADAFGVTGYDLPRLCR